MTFFRTSLVLALFAHLPLFAQHPAVATPIPFVGCKSDGQVGPLEAPGGKAQRLPIPASASQRLAYYKAAQGFGVLAPRDWYCFGTYGSGGNSLLVSPQPINPADLFGPERRGVTGPAIQFVRRYGDTSGRFEVAGIIARVFAAHKAFVDQVTALLDLAPFPSGPYLADLLTYKSDEIVEYQTPPQSDGLGTHSLLLRNAEPISGVAVLIGSDPDLLLLAVRLPPGLTDLTPAIIQQAERDGAAPDK